MDSIAILAAVNHPQHRSYRAFREMSKRTCDGDLVTGAPCNVSIRGRCKYDARCNEWRLRRFPAAGIHVIMFIETKTIQCHTVRELNNILKTNSGNADNANARLLIEWNHDPSPLIGRGYTAN